ncbi:hypothetical protein SHKM778_35430 [Streptomyces sp. KM77-8]|uniref:DUF4276 family protein n=1 Tax=Streptomyces haneummycinicus TaxID=3074435 RepID=A0AAT9HI31_9ACTN
MTPKNRGQERRVIVLAGEDQNDCEILASLIRAHRPDLTADARMVRINDPVRLRRKSGPDLAAAVRTLAGKARAKALQQRADLLGFVVHEDLDGYTDSQYDRIRKALSEEFGRQCQEFRTAVALAAWESEGWLLLFPDAFLTSVRAGRSPTVCSARTPAASRTRRRSSSEDSACRCSGRATAPRSPARR